MVVRRVEGQGMTQPEFKDWWPGFLNEYWAALTASYHDPVQYGAIANDYLAKGLEKIYQTRRKS